MKLKGNFLPANKKNTNINHAKGKTESVYFFTLALSKRNIKWAIYGILNLLVATFKNFLNR